MKKIISLLLCAVMCLTAMLTLAGCKKNKGDGSGSGNGGNGGSNPDALIIMTEALDGLFNPFFSTSANDATIVSMTQIGMLTSKYVNGEAVVAYGEDEATATLDFESYYDEDLDQTVYTFVIKNGIQYSDGHPLTIEDVLFNLYVYLDPAYTGSATIYSTEIQGLAAYRAQDPDIKDGDSDNETLVNELASERALNRILTLVECFRNVSQELNPGASSYNVPKDKMIEYITNGTYHETVAYLEAVATEDEYSSVTYQQLLDDYYLTLEYFEEELNNDYNNSIGAYTDEPYKSHEEFNDEIFCFMYAEGYVDVEYERNADGVGYDKNNIKKLTANYSTDTITTREAAINKVFNDKIKMSLDEVLLAWGTSTKLKTDYTAKAKDIILNEDSMNEDGTGLKVPNISGIVSLGHTTSTQSVTVNGNTYAVAHEHNADGTPKNSEEYDVLTITINGVDPKAVWNFAFSVAPEHYYGAGDSVGVDIANNQFGVVWSSFDFMKNVLQTPTNNRLPMGAGPYKATNRANDDNPDRKDFYSNNIVYFKANNYFETVGSGLNNAKIGKIRYQVISATQAISELEKGSVHYITPQYSQDNYSIINDLVKNSHFESITTDQLGYGYIGINASEVEDINLRRAIMCAMNTTLSVQYYASGTAEQIYYPMSQVSWAYPKDESGNYLKLNGTDYPQANGTFSEDVARANIEYYMSQADYTSSDLKLTFTIAGTSLQDHPTYTTFRDAAKLLNSMGWDITVEADQQALTKLATGSLQVWAAAWGSSLDPDMYQVYHKNSTATSTLAWGYPGIKSRQNREEIDLLNELSELIEQARETEDRAIRSEIYLEAMECVLDLAIELPVYQRSTVYMYNTDVIDSSTIPSDINPYSSPLDRIWEIDFKH